jgi:methyl-accepting chemotaxis protein
MMRKKKNIEKARWGVRTRLNLAFIIVLLIPSLLIGFFSYEKARNNVEEQLAGAAVENVGLLDHTIDQMLQAKKQEVEFLAAHIQVSTIQSGNDKAVRDILMQFQNTQPMLERTYIGTETGKFIKWPVTEMKKGYDPRERPWYKDAVNRRGETIITSPYIAASSKNMVVTIAKVTEDGKGVVGMDVSLQKLADITKKVHIGKYGYAFILDNQGNVIVHPAYEPGKKITDASGLQSTLQAASGQYEITTQKEKNKIIYVTNKETGWKIGGTMLMQEADDAARPVLYTMVIVILITTVVGAIFVYFFVSSITSRLKKLMMGADKVKQGDLSETIEVETDDELGQLGHSFNQMNESLRNIVAHMNDTAEHVAASSEELSAGSEQTKMASKRITDIVHQVVAEYKKQEERVEATANIVKEMATAVQHIAHHAESVSDSAVRSSELSGEGKHAIETVSEKMNVIYETVKQLDIKMERLGTRSQEIGKIVAFINEISEQTNLLSLNAAIEAARAGDQGRGFAVVADEVRKLANQTGEASDKIAQEIYRIQREIEDIVHDMKQGAVEVEDGIHTVTVAGESFIQIDKAVQEVTGQIQEVSASSEQMAASTEEVVAAISLIAEITSKNNRSLQNISTATDEQLVSMDEISSSSRSLAHLAEQMQQQLRQFKL